MLKRSKNTLQRQLEYIFDAWIKLTTDQSLSQFFRASDDVTFYIISNRERSRSNFFLYFLSDQGSLGMTSSRNIAIGQESTSCEKLHDIAIDQKRPSFLGQEVLHDHLTLSEYDNQVELSLRLDVKQQKNKKFPLYVKTRSGKMITTEAVWTDTILDVKRKITEEMGTLVDQLQLMFDNQKLVDEHRTLKSYKITRDSTIELIIGRKYVIETFTHV